MATSSTARRVLSNTLLANTLLLGSLLLAACFEPAGNSVPPPEPATTSSGPAESAFTYDAWSQALQQVDDQGLVDYAALVAEPSALRSFYGSLANLAPATFASWSEQDRIAFWINAYNALTLLAIVDRWPLERTGMKSMIHPRGIRWITGVWDRLQWTVLGQTVTLDDIEHQILRKEFIEPRIHAALVCGAMSCPPLRNTAFEGPRLDDQLDDQMERFVTNPRTGLAINRERGQVLLSKIFDWYGADFVATDLPATGYGSHAAKERATLAAASFFLSDEDRGFLEQAEYSVGYLDYDWSLNEQPIP
jgi:hypothetical protein